MGSFGFRYSDVVLNIEHTVADRISNANAHGPSKNEFTSPFYFLSVFTVRIRFAIFSGSKYDFLLKRKITKKEEKNVYQQFKSEQNTKVSF